MHPQEIGQVWSSVSSKEIMKEFKINQETVYNIWKDTHEDYDGVVALCVKKQAGRHHYNRDMGFAGDQAAGLVPLGSTGEFFL